MDAREAILADADAFPLANLQPLRARVRYRGPKRLAALAAMLDADDPATAELYLEEFIARTQRQVRAHMCVHETFARRVRELPPEIRERLPAELGTLARVAEKTALPVVEPRLMAHALTVDGAFRSWLRGAQSWREVLEVADGGLTEARGAYKRLAQRHHPDRGGDAEMFDAIKRAWEQAREDLAA